MAGIANRAGMAAGLRRLVDQLSWEGRRGVRTYLRRFQMLGVVLAVCAAIIVIALYVQTQQMGELNEIKERQALLKQRVVKPVANQNIDGRERLKIFEDYLLSHEDIPNVVQDLINLAEDSQLSIARGDYRPQVDTQGGFLRYRMTLPVKGDVKAIHRFMLSALRKQKSLALESVQFKRERIDTAQMEARIQWVLLTRMPAGVVSAEPKRSGGRP